MSVAIKYSCSHRGCPAECIVEHGGALSAGWGFVEDPYGLAVVCDEHNPERFQLQDERNKRIWNAMLAAMNGMLSNGRQFSIEQEGETVAESCARSAVGFALALNEEFEDYTKTQNEKHRTNAD